MLFHEGYWSFKIHWIYLLCVWRPKIRIFDIEKNSKSADYVRRKILFVDQYLFRIPSVIKQRSEHFCYQKLE